MSMSSRTPFPSLSVPATVFGPEDVGGDGGEDDSLPVLPHASTPHAQHARMSILINAENLW